MAMNVRRGAKRRYKVAAPKDKNELADQKKGFKWNDGQQAVIDALLHRDGKEIRELLIAAGSRCFAAGTLVHTLNGMVPIEDLLPGDSVLSVDTETGELQGQQVLKIFHNKKQGHKKKIVTFVMSSGARIKCTEVHEIYQKGRKTPAGDVARRIMENHRRNGRGLSGEQFGPDTDAELEMDGGDPRNETGTRRERVSADNDPQRREGVDHKSSPDSGADLVAESRKPAGGEPFEQCTGRQPHREPGVGDQKYKQGVDDVAGKTDEEYRLEKRHEQEIGPDRGQSEGDTREIRSYRYETGGVGGTLWYNCIGYAGHNIRSALEAREINEDNVADVIFSEEDIDTYDICVAKNHNYLVGEDCIQVGNSGKTFMIVALFVTIALKYAESRQLMARKYFAHIKGAIWADTLPKVLQVLFPEVQPHIYWNNTDYYIQFHNGSEIWFAGLDDKERVDKILGREYLNIFFNEASEIDYETYLIVKTRLAQKIEGIVNRVFVDENPPSSKHWTKKLFVDRKDPQNDKMPIANPQRYFYYQIHPWQNAENVSADYLEMLRSMPEKQKKRFYDGEFRDDSEHALWKTDDINRLRIPMGAHPPLRKIVVALDPAVTAKEESDETGIIVMGVGYNGHLYTLADYTGKYSATAWAAKAVEAYNIWQADEIIAEVNNGGDLVEVNIKSTEGGKYIPYRGVHATRDKYTRAEPVAALTEKGMAHHVGHFPDLEEEQTTWAAKKGEKSPNRIDANVWAAFALIPEMEGFRQRAGVGGSFMQAMRGNL